MKLIPFLLAFAPCASAQVVELRITEVLVDPIGMDAGRQIIEYENTGNVDIDTSTWYLSVGTTTVAFPAVKIPYRTIGRIHIRRAGTSSKADIFFPTLPVLTRADTVTIFKSKSFKDPKALVDFVSWGGGKGQITLAVQANQWKSSFETVLPPSKEGHSIAHYMRDSWGRLHAAEDWYQDGTPTLGTSNDPGSMFAWSTGCKGMTNPPGMGLINEKSRAWTGEPWEVDLYNLPRSAGTAIVFLGFAAITPIPLDLAGMPGCSLAIRVDATFVVPRNLRVGKLASTIPNDPTLVGGEFYLQALIVDSAYANAARAATTSAVIVKIGSR